jgi:hypothetical protein
MEENLVSIKLVSKQGIDTYLDPKAYEGCLERKIPVTVIINSSDETITDFDYRDYKLFKDKETGHNIYSVGTFNKCIFLMSYAIDECDHSCLELKILPQQEGQNLYLHVLVGN